MNKLTDYELKELMQRGGNFEQGMNEQGQVIDEGYLADRVGGLGAHA